MGGGANLKLMQKIARTIEDTESRKIEIYDNSEETRVAKLICSDTNCCDS